MLYSLFLLLISCSKDPQLIENCSTLAFDTSTLQELTTTTGDNIKGADPYIILDNKTYKMWFTTGTTEITGTAYAESSDGYIWNIINDKTNLQFRPTSNTWDADGVETVSVLKRNNKYYLWYLGYEGHFNSDSTTYTKTNSIGLATSIDGKNWTKYANNPVVKIENDWEQLWGSTIIENGKTTTIYKGGPEEPSVIWDEQAQLFKMWYACGTTLNNKWKYRIGYAVSTNGFDWTKHLGNPIFIPTENGWDNKITSHTNVQKVNNTYFLSYAGGQQANNLSIGMANSTDGIVWNRNSNAIIKITNKINGGPSMLIDNNLPSPLLYFMIADSTFTNAHLNVVKGKCNN